MQVSSYQGLRQYFWNIFGCVLPIIRSEVCSAFKIRGGAVQHDLQLVITHSSTSRDSHAADNDIKTSSQNKQTANSLRSNEMSNQTRAISHFFHKPIDSCVINEIWIFFDNFSDTCRKSWCYPQYSVHDAAGHEVLAIKGPQNFCIGPTVFQDQLFDIVTIGHRQRSVGSITMHYSGNASEAFKELYVKCKWMRVKLQI